MTRRISNGQWHIVSLKKTAGESWMQKTIELYPVLSILQVRESTKSKVFSDDVS